MPRARVIVNPTAGRGAAVAFGAFAADTLSAVGYDAEVRPTTGPGHATILARDAGPVERIVVVGGDGTLREAAEALVGDDAPAVELGFVPMGNANVVARELEIPLDPEGALAVLERGVPRPVDVGVVDDRIFLAMVGVGYDAWVTRRVTAFRRTRFGGAFYRLWGDGAYGAIGGAALLVPFPRAVRVSVDGEPCTDDAASVLVCNTETYAKGWAAAPGARVDDGALDVCAARLRGPVGTARWVVAQSRRRRVESARVRYARGAAIRIESDRPFPWQADGDPMDDRTSLDLTIRPGALRVLAPAPARDDVRGS